MQITALFSNLFARVQLVRHAAQIRKPPCTIRTESRASKISRVLLGKLCELLCCSVLY